MRFILVTLVAVFGASSFANSMSSSACAAYCDYICRHYKGDLKPVELRLTKRNAGDFYVYTLALRIKNVGQTPTGPTSGSRSLKIYVSGLGQRTAVIHGQIQPGHSRWVGLGAVSPRRIRHCTKLKVHVDNDRQFSQFGCMVYANDKQVLTVYEAGKKKFCRFPIGHLKPIDKFKPIR